MPTDSLNCVHWWIYDRDHRREGLTCEFCGVTEAELAGSMNIDLGDDPDGDNSDYPY